MKKLITHQTCLTAAIVYGPIGIFRCWSDGKFERVCYSPFFSFSPPVSSRLFLLAPVSLRCERTLSTDQKGTACSLKNSLQNFVDQSIVTPSELVPSWTLDSNHVRRSHHSMTSVPPITTRVLHCSLYKLK